MSNEYLELIDAYIDRELRPAEAERLREWLAQGDANIALFARQIFYHQQLRETLVAQNAVECLSEIESADTQSCVSCSGPEAKPAVTLPAATGRAKLLAGYLSPPFNWNVAGMLLALSAILMLGGIIGWRIRGSGVAPVDVGAGQVQSVPVAYLASVNRCDWGGQAESLWHIGRSIQSGDEVTLYEGVAEFRLTSGVSLSVEGPAALIVNSPTSLVVQYGKLTAVIPWEVNDFKVLASTCRITAADAEFGVNVVGNNVDIHVFSGEVIASSSPFQEVRPAEWELGAESSSPVLQEADVPADAEFTKVRVPSGGGLKLSSREGRMRISRWHPANESEFTNKLTMVGPLPVTGSYINAVLQSKPVGYWRFESLKENCIPNEVSPGNSLLMVGVVKLIGGDGNRVADFGRVGSNGHYVSTEPVDALSVGDYSVEVWAKPSHYHRGGLVALARHPHFASAMVEPTNVHGFSLELTGPLYSRALKVQGLREGDRNRIRFLHRDPPGNDYYTGTSCFSKAAYQPRQWQHIVAVKSGSRMGLYMDGRLTATADDTAPLAKNLHLEVGQLIGVMNALPFVGQLDELSIYDRALSDQEILKHYQSIDFQQ